MVSVVGLDLSLTATGVCRIVIGDDRQLHSISADTIDPGTATGHERIRHVRQSVREWILSPFTPRLPDLIVVEGPSYRSHGTYFHETAGLWWNVTHMLWASGAPYAMVAPTARAKYATGTGAASKDGVLLAVARRYRDVEMANNNESDALILAAMGARHLGHPIEPSLPLTHTLAMNKVAWPDRGAAI